jgi:hypothetical protein
MNWWDRRPCLSSSALRATFYSALQSKVVA